MPRIKLGKRIFPFEDLLVRDLADIFLNVDTDEVKIVLAAQMGLGPTQPHMIATDEAGRQLLGDAAARLGQVSIIDSAAISSSVAQVYQPIDTLASRNGLGVSAQTQVWNGGQFDRLRSASAVTMAAQGGKGIGLASPPGMWSVVSNPAAGAVASATKAAGAAGVVHVCTGILITFGAIAAPVATALTWALRDGASGAGTILAQGQLAIPAAAFQGAPIMLTDLAIPGTAATAMTLEFSALLANLLEGVTLLGFDAS